MRRKQEVKTVYFRSSFAAEMDLYDMSIVCVGRTSVLPGYKFGPFRKGDNSLIIVCSGRGFVRSSGNEESFSAGDVVGLLQDQTYMWRTDPQALLKHYWLIIKGPAGRKCLEALGFSESKSILYRRKVPETEITLLEELMKFCRLQPEGQSWKIMALFYELLPFQRADGRGGAEKRPGIQPLGGRQSPCSH
ncbi:MAG TPA: hypothetical protein GXX29_15400 [Firmicutes bacterium]|nr:hypothetical protein [Bacillota bacterium]